MRLWVCENRALRRIFGPKREEVTRGWKRSYNEEVHITCTLPNIISVSKSRSMRWAGNVARMGQMRNAYKIFVEILKSTDHAEDLGVDGRIILEWILVK